MLYHYDQRFLDLPRFSSERTLRVTDEQRQRAEQLIGRIWPEHDLNDLYLLFTQLVAEASRRMPADQHSDGSGWSESQLVLICYGDHLHSGRRDQTPLQVLGEFCRMHFTEPEFSHLTLHLLPIYTSPYKDGGFDVADPFAVNPRMGTWEDVRSLQQYVRIALDFVANHLSVASEWFARYLADDPFYQDFFIGFDDEATVRRLEREAVPQIYRPRPHNPLIPVTRPDGSTRWVYMTFSNHQADVNYHNPRVFLKMLEVLLFYMLQGATLIRLDAIPYLWKEWGTPCAHHPTTHALLELFRLATDLVHPGVKLLAESMEPLADSQRYLSTPTQAKAQMAYNFAPCGLIPHTVLTADASVFQRHLRDFLPPGPETQWAVVCGVTHDGSSLNPCRAPQSVSGEAVLNESQINQIARTYTEHGYQEIAARSALAPDHPQYVRADFIEHFTSVHGKPPRFVNYKATADSRGEPVRIVYEAISTYASLFDHDAQKIIAALAMALGLPGIPFIYITLPFAACNDYDLYLATGNPRELNRGRVLLEDLQRDLANPNTLTYHVFSAYKQLLRLRASQPAFHPQAQCVPLHPEYPALLAFLRISRDNSQFLVVVHNISSAPQTVTLSLPDAVPHQTVQAVDLISGQEFQVNVQTMSLKLDPFGMRWLECR